MKQHTFFQALGGLVFLAGLFFLNFTSRVIFSPLLPVIEAEMGISHAQSGSFFLCISAGYFLSILSSGFVSSRITHKWTIVLSSLTLGMALLVLGRCTTFATLQAGLFTLGLGAGLYFPSALATIAELVVPSHLSRGMAIHELAPNLGFVVAPLLCALSSRYVSWRPGLAYFGASVVLVGLVYALSPHGSSQKGKAPNLAATVAYGKMPMFWGMVVLFSLAICSTLGIYAMAPLFLVIDHGMDLEDANRLLALSRVASVMMPLVGGWLGDRYGKQLVMALVLLCTGLLTGAMALVGGGAWLRVFVVLQPLFAVCFFPVGFAVLLRLGDPKSASLAVSLCLPLAFLIGGGLMPTLIGTIGDLYSIATGILVVGALMAIGGGCSLIVTLRIRSKMLV